MSRHIARINIPDLRGKMDDYVYTLREISGLSIKDAIAQLDNVISMRTPIPYPGTSHPHQRGIGTGKYPRKSSILLRRALDQLYKNFQNRHGVEHGINEVILGRYTLGKGKPTTKMIRKAYGRGNIVRISQVRLYIECYNNH